LCFPPFPKGGLRGISPRRDDGDASREDESEILPDPPLEKEGDLCFSPFPKGGLRGISPRRDDGDASREDESEILPGPPLGKEGG
jgi:hypothetical protein